LLGLNWRIARPFDPYDENADIDSHLEGLLSDICVALGACSHA